ncbi:MAG: bis(5'-nucleosyl)-tetraphosphatase (symmetrical) YqeK [Oscillospiraceae bacterium]
MDFKEIIMTIEDYKKILKDKLSDKRYHHCLCVADEAKRLSEKYGADPNKVYLAGLLHDILKDTGADEMLQIAGQFDIILSNVEMASPKLWHAIIGAEYCKRILNIHDEGILSAIRYHTTAKEEMTTEEKILYVADFTSSDRSYDDIDVIRAAADESLDSAMKIGLLFTIRELTANEQAVHIDTVKAYNKIITEERKAMNGK